jgi:putative FmdB family regulatory protein
VRLTFSAIRVQNGEEAVPHYNFSCRACKKEFSKVLTLAEYEKGGIVCPHCKSKDVEQRWAAFYAVTSKKS